MIAPATIPALALAAALAAPEGADTFILVTRDLSARTIQLVEIDDGSLVHVDDAQWRRVDLDACVCLVRPDAAPARSAGGVIHLADGQRLSGSIATGGADGASTVAWMHSRLGTLAIPLDRVSSVVFDGAAAPPPAGEGDVVGLVNGDHVEGFVTGIGPTVEIEVDTDGGPHLVGIPAGRVTGIRMVTPRLEPAGRRVWLDDRTILDAPGLALSEDGRLHLRHAFDGGEAAIVPIGAVLAVQFDAAGLLPLAGLEPARIEGPATRYELPAPRALDPEAPLGLSTLRVSGPIVVRYELPAGPKRFAATARLAPGMERWGDLILVVRDDGREIVREQINARRPEITINTELTGAELSLEIEEGANGPIQDAVELDRAMISY